MKTQFISESPSKRRPDLWTSKRLRAVVLIRYLRYLRRSIIGALIRHGSQRIENWLGCPQSNAATLALTFGTNPLVRLGRLVQVEKRGSSSDYLAGSIDPGVHQFDPVVVSDEASLQLDKMKAMGGSTR